MQRMRLLILKRTASQIAKQFQGGVKGEWGRKQQQFVTILHVLQ